VEKSVAKKVGIIGLGLVGTAIAESATGGLAEKFDVVGFDIDSAKCEKLKQLGARAVSSLSVLAQETNRVILCLPDTDVVLQVVEGPGGILEACLRRNATCRQAEVLPTYIIDTTTGDPEETEKLAQRLAKREIYFLDAPFSGSSAAVRSRDVVFMVGGNEVAFAACKDIFQALARKIFYLGPSGSGSRAKLASNLVLGLNRLALAEGLVFAGKLGLEPQAFLELLKATPAYSAVMDTKGKKMVSGDFTPQARLRQHHKDVSIILKYAQKYGQELPLSSVHLDVLAKAIAAGEGELDNSAVIREIKRRTMF